MTRFLLAAVVEALAEIGDKSQFMLLLLSFRFRGETVSVVGGMVTAMAISLILAAAAGAWFAAHIDPAGLHWAAGLLFLGMVGLALLSDHGQRLFVIRSGGTFVTVLITILVAEIGDKSQLASAVSSADGGSPLPLLGTIIGAWTINLPVAIAGPWLAETLVSKGLTIQWISRIMAVPFAVLALIQLSQVVAF